MIHHPTRLAACLVAAITAIWCDVGFAQPSFIAPDNRLPSPYQPYVMQDEPVAYGGGAAVLYELRFQAVDPADVGFPDTGIDSQWFDETFPITYDMVWSVGAGPPIETSGLGTMHATGATPLGLSPFFVQVHQLDLPSPGTLPAMTLREVPGSELGARSTGMINTTFVAPLSPERRISSSLSILSEITLDGGATWLSADSAINLVQTPEPSSIGLAGVCLVGAVGLARSRRRGPGRCPKAV